VSGFLKGGDWTTFRAKLTSWEQADLKVVPDRALPAGLAKENSGGVGGAINGDELYLLEYLATGMIRLHGDDDPSIKAIAPKLEALRAELLVLLAKAVDTDAFKSLLDNDLPRMKQGSHTALPLMQCVRRLAGEHHGKPTAENTKELRHFLGLTFSASPALDYDSSYVTRASVSESPKVDPRRIRLFTLYTLMMQDIDYVEISQPIAKVPVPKSFADKLRGEKKKVLDACYKPADDKGECAKALETLDHKKADAKCSDDEKKPGSTEACTKAKASFKPWPLITASRLDDSVAWYDTLFSTSAVKSIAVRIFPMYLSSILAGKLEGEKVKVMRQGKTSCVADGDASFPEPEHAYTQMLLEELDFVTGVDLASPETACYQAPHGEKKDVALTGAHTFHKLASMLSEVGKKRSRRVHMHVHCGEGYPMFDYPKILGDAYKPEEFTTMVHTAKAGFKLVNPDDDDEGFGAADIEKYCEGLKENVLKPNAVVMSGDEPLHYGTGRSNIDAILANLALLHQDVRKHIRVRLGHSTHATFAQSVKMKSLEVDADINLSSNLATQALVHGVPRMGQLEKLSERHTKLIATAFAPHGLLNMFAAGVRVLLGTDGSGVEHSWMPNEFEIADKLVDLLQRTCFASAKAQQQKNKAWFLDEWSQSSANAVCGEWKRHKGHKLACASPQGGKCPAWDNQLAAYSLQYVQENF
jgi:hypothetical protein